MVRASRLFCYGYYGYYGLVVYGKNIYEYHSPTA